MWNKRRSLFRQRGSIYSLYNKKCKSFDCKNVWSCLLLQSARKGVVRDNLHICVYVSKKWLAFLLFIQIAVIATALLASSLFCTHKNGTALMGENFLRMSLVTRRVGTKWKKLWTDTFVGEANSWAILSKKTFQLLKSRVENQWEMSKHCLRKNKAEWFRYHFDVEFDNWWV